MNHMFFGGQILDTQKYQADMFKKVLSLYKYPMGVKLSILEINEYSGKICVNLCAIQPCPI